MLHDYEIMIPAGEFSNFNSGKEIVVNIPIGGMEKKDELK